MFIIKFNKLIRNKWLWGAFATIVAIAFAGSDLLRSGGGEGGEAAGAGTLGGRKVSFREYDMVRQQIHFEKQMEGRESLPEGAELEEMVWQKLAVLRTAELMGLKVSDEEIMETLRHDPSFQDADGRFNAGMYHAILENMLGMTQGSFEAIRRNQILAGKLEGAIASSAWGVPSMAREQGRGMTDRFTVSVVDITNTFRNAEIEISEEELQSFHEENRANYRIPDQVRVKYAHFSAGKYLNEVKLEEDDMRDYYDANMERFKAAHTNRTEHAFEDYRDEVEAELRKYGARELAADAAADFADLFYYGDKVSSPDDFESLAAARGASVRTTGWFSAESAPAGIDRTADFVSAAFDLEEEPMRDRFSDAVVGENSCYVLAFMGARPARDPELAEIEESVRADALAQARSRLFWEHVEKVWSAVTRDIDNGMTLAESVAEFGLTPGTNQVLTAIDAYRELPGGTALATRMTRMGAGDVSNPVAHSEGAAFLQVLEREAGEEMQLQIIGSQMAQKIRNDISEAVLADWRKFNLDKMNLVTTRAGYADDATED